MLNLRIEDRNPHLKDELHEIMVENKDIFQSVLNGEDEYADSLGWFSVDKWASHEEVQKLKKISSSYSGKCRRFCDYWSWRL